MSESLMILLGSIGFVVFGICTICILWILYVQSQRNFVLAQNPVQLAPVTRKPDEFSITRQDISAFAMNQDPEFITLKEKPDPQFPYSLKWKNKTFHMLYGTDKGVIMIARLREQDAKGLSKRHNIQPSKFPRGKNWFVIPIDNTFTNREQVTDITLMAIDYIQNPNK